MTPSSSSPTSSGARLVKGLGSLLALLAIIVGVPALLVVIGAFPTTVPSLSQVWTSMTTRDNGTVLFVVFAAGVWACWALFTVATVQETVAALRGLPAAPVRGLSAFQRPAAGLVMGVAMLFAVNVAHASPAQAAVPLHQGLGMTQAVMVQAPAAQQAQVESAASMSGAASAVAGVANRAGAGLEQAAPVAGLDQSLAHALSQRSQGENPADAQLPATPAPMLLNQAGAGMEMALGQLGQRSGQVPDAAAEQAAVVVTAAGVNVDEQGVSQYTVKRHDTLWSIAKNYLGDPLRYREIAELNPTLVDGEGGIKTGAVLVLPSVMDEGPQLVPTAFVAREGVPQAPTGGQQKPVLPVAQAAAGKDVAPETVTVKPGDTLWGLAQQHLGDGQKYTQIFHANQQVVQPDGQQLRDADLIQPGWTFTVDDPDEETPPPPPPVQHPDASSTSDASTAAPSTESSAQPSTQPGEQPSEQPTAQQDASTAAPSTESSAQPSTQPGEQPSEQPTAQQEAGDFDLMASATPLAQPGSDQTQDQTQGGLSVSARYLSLASGAGLLAAGSVVALTRGRRRQFRFRRPGKAMPASEVGVLPMEQVLHVAGEPARATADFLDVALRNLVVQVRRGNLARLPEVVAASINEQELCLVLANTTDQLPHPWVEGAPGRWSLPRHVAAGLRVQREEVPAPYPCLVGVGYTDEGTEWLVDLEHVGVVQVEGDPQRSCDVARYVAGQLATNQWSDHLTLTLVGFGQQMVPGRPERLAYSQNLAQAVGQVMRDAQVNAAAALPAGDVLAGRVSGQRGDVWMPQVVLAVPGPDQPAPSEQDSAALAQLQQVHSQLPVRSATAVAMVMGKRAPAAHPANQWVLHVDEQAMLTIPALGLTMHAHQLSHELAKEWADTLADARMQKPPAQLPAWAGGLTTAAGALASDVGLPREQAVPVEDRDDKRADEGGYVGRRRAKHSGGYPPLAAVPDWHTGPNPVQAAAPAAGSLMASSLLPLPNQQYLNHGATTVEDLQTLAPLLEPGVREQIRAADPSLDEDVRDWLAALGPRPRLRMLGPVAVHAFGRRPDKQVDFCTEVVAYIASHPQGVGSAALASQLWPGKNYSGSSTYPREMVSRTRHWLGMDADGRRYLPEVSRTGSDVYRLQGVLVDVDLFRRLRARGQARGAEGIADLVQALDLVSGAPLDRRRLGGYGWLDPGEEYLYTGMIVDVAHIVATHALATGDLLLARRACEVARSTGSSDDVALLDLAALHYAQGSFAEAEAVIAKVLTNNEAQVEEDLPPRTYEVLLRIRNRCLTRVG